jgi:hypothetical protein
MNKERKMLKEIEEEIQISSRMYHPQPCCDT